MKGYRPWQPHHPFLFPPSPTDWLPKGHLAYFLLDVVEELDLSGIEAPIHAKDPRGTRPYHPRMMTALLLYGYCVGVPSSRRMERAAQEDVAFRVICGGNTPDHTSISEFRRQHLKALSELFTQVLRLCQEAGLVKLGHVALDGTKVPANASKHKAMSYERMLLTEEELRRQVGELLEGAEKQDVQEDEQYGKGRRGDELPEELARRESRLRKIREARERLEAEAARARARELEERAAEAREKAEQAEDADREATQRRAEAAERKAEEAAEKAQERAKRWKQRTQEEAEEARANAKTEEERRAAGRLKAKAEEAARAHQKALDLRSDRVANGAAPQLPEHRVPSDKDGNPTEKAQMNFTDPDSRIMKKGSDYLQGYNCQIAVDAENQIIVAQAVTNQAPDQEHLEPLLSRVAQNCGTAPAILTADAGYWSEGNVARCEALGTEPLISPTRQRRGQQPDAPSATTCDFGDAKSRMQERLQSQSGRELYARRKAIVEPPFGQIKSARRLDRFLLRGLEKVGGEWQLVCLTHNLLKLFRAQRPACT